MKSVIFLVLWVQLAEMAPARFVSLASLGLDLTDKDDLTLTVVVAPEKPPVTVGSLTDVTYAQRMVPEKTNCSTDVDLTTSVKPVDDKLESDVVTLGTAAIPDYSVDSVNTSKGTLLLNSTLLSPITQDKSDQVPLDIGDYDYDDDFDYQKTAPIGEKASLISQTTVPTVLEPLLVTAWDVLLNYLKMPGGPAVVATMTILGKCRT